MTRGTSQTIAEDVKIATFCKVWGFLKYYHPAVTIGKIDWDDVFLKKINGLKKLQSKQELQAFYSSWLDDLGTVKKRSSVKTQASKTFTMNADYNFLLDCTVFSQEIIHRFNAIRERKLSRKNYYVQQTLLGTPLFKNEKVYADSVFPCADMRLLSLSRYWNVIHYFFPYKYVIGEDWNAVLLDMLPLFRDAKDTLDYHLAMLQLTVRINDSHALFSTAFTLKYFGENRVPFYAKIVENKAVVTVLINDSLCSDDDIKKGDLFLKIDGKEVREHLQQKNKYLSASNEAVKIRGLSNYLFSGNSNTVICLINRNGQISEKVVRRYSNNLIGVKKNMRSDTCRLLDGNIGYLNLGLLKPSQTKKYLNKLRHTKALIIDVRNYPNNTLYILSRFLNPAVVPFAIFTKPEFKQPGLFKFTEPYYCGRKNKHPYEGQVILLFNEKTQSHAEFTLMALKTAPRVMSIGSQTSGADGNVSTLIFPGNFKTTFTGIGVYYPDGRETQRIGIVPDIPLRPSVEGLQQNRDELMEKALEVISTMTKK